MSVMATSRQLRRNLPHHSASLVIAALSAGGCCPKQIAVCIHGYAAVRMSAVAAAAKVVQRSVRPAAFSRAQLEHASGTTVVITIERAVQITCGIDGERSSGSCSVAAAGGEVVEHGVDPTAMGGAQLEDHAA